MAYHSGSVSCFFFLILLKIAFVLPSLEHCSVLRVIVTVISVSFISSDNEFVHHCISIFSFFPSG